VTLIAIIQVFNAVALALTIALDRSVLPDDAEEHVALVLVGLGVALAGVAIGAGLWTLRRWAWTATMVWVGIEMAASLHGWAEGDPNYLPMAIGLAQVFYLNQREVQRTFTRGSATDRRWM
jgi:hypothetical protein